MKWKWKWKYKKMSDYRVKNPRSMKVLQSFGTFAAFAFVLDNKRTSIEWQHEMWT